MEKEIKKEVRNKRFGGSLTKTEFKMLTSMAKELRISKTELIVKAVQLYKESMLNEKMP